MNDTPSNGYPCPVRLHPCDVWRDSIAAGEILLLHGCAVTRQLMLAAARWGKSSIKAVKHGLLQRH
jgi:hypothetical protein